MNQDILFENSPANLKYNYKNESNDENLKNIKKKQLQIDLTINLTKRKNYNLDNKNKNC